MSLDRISIFLPSLVGGGAERVTVLLANGLVEKGVQVDLVLAKAFGDYLPLVDTRIKIVDFGAAQVSQAFPKLVKYVSQTKPDILLSAMTHANLWAILAKKLSGSSFTSVIITQHSSWEQILANQPRLKEKMLFEIARYIYPLADGIITISEQMRAELIRNLPLRPAQVARIYNPVVSPSLARLCAMEPEHPWYKDKKTPLIIAVGRLSPEKDYKTLLSAYKKVKEQIECRLIILGEGAERTNLLNLANSLDITEYIDLPGFVSNPYAWIARSNLFVLSSRYEGLPTVLIEALACGTPVVSTNCISGPAEILENGKFGDLVPVGDVEALAKAIIHNIRHPRPKDPLMERGNEFSVEVALQAYLDYFQQVKQQARS